MDWMRGMAISAVAARDLETAKEWGIVDCREGRRKIEWGFWMRRVE